MLQLGTEASLIVRLSVMSIKDKTSFPFLHGDTCNVSLLMFSEVVFLVYKNNKTLKWHTVIKQKTPQPDFIFSRVQKVWVSRMNVKTRPA